MNPGKITIGIHRIHGQPRAATLWSLLATDHGDRLRAPDPALRSVKVVGHRITE